MLAEIRRAEDSYVARFERHLNYPVAEVWSWLTENEKLSKWFPELRIEELRRGGHLTFDMQNGHYEKMTITDYASYSVLEFTWDKDKVRFELYEASEGCKLVMKETIMTITDHTPRDLAGWHVCLDVIETLLDGRIIQSRKKEWEKRYEQYVRALEDVSGK